MNADSRSPIKWLYVAVTLATSVFRRPRMIGEVSDVPVFE
jgi:hypothetical protein